MGGGQWRPIREWRLHLRPQAAARDRPRAEPAGKAHEGCAGGGPAPPARQAARLLRSDSDRGGRGRPGKRLHAGGRGRGGLRRRTDKLEHADRSEEHTSELQSLMRTSYAVFCLKKKKTHNPPTSTPEQ